MNIRSLTDEVLEGSSSDELKSFEDEIKKHLERLEEDVSLNYLLLPAYKQTPFLESARVDIVRYQLAFQRVLSYELLKERKE